MFIVTGNDYVSQASVCLFLFFIYVCFIIFIVIYFYMCFAAASVQIIVLIKVPFLLVDILWYKFSFVLKKR